MTRSESLPLGVWHICSVRIKNVVLCTSCVSRSLELFQLNFIIHNVSEHKLKVTLKVDQGQRSLTLQCYSRHKVALKSIKTALSFTAPAPPPVEWLSECGGTAEVVEKLDYGANRKCTLLLRKFNLDSEELDTPGTNTEVSVCLHINPPPPLAF